MGTPCLLWTLRFGTATIKTNLIVAHCRQRSAYLHSQPPFAALRRDDFLRIGIYAKGQSRHAQSVVLGSHIALSRYHHLK